MTYETRIKAVVVLPKKEPLFSEMGTTVSIDDTAAGEFVEVSQNAPDTGKILINPDEWQTLRTAIDKMVAECREVKEAP